MTELPHAYADDAPADADDAPRVLLVDDDEVNLLVTGAALAEYGFVVDSVGSGAEALAAVQAEVPDVVVLDARMPGMDGFETCRRLRALPGLDGLPVLMLTGLDDDASITRSYRAGANDFFVKSTQWMLLAGRLRYLLRASRTRQELERAKTRLARAQDLARMGSFDWRRGQGDASCKLHFSPEALRVFGLGARDTLTMRQLLRMVPREHRARMLGELHRVLRHGGALATDVPLLLRDQRQRVVHIDGEPEFNEQAQDIGYTGIVQDVTDRRAAEDKIRHLANFDALTGLPNRRQLIWRTERALEHAQRGGYRAALLLIDLDRFKNVNDTLGHTAGDELLVEVARRLRSCVRHSEQALDSLVETMGSRSHRLLESVGRLGGDEFVALLPEVASDDDAQRVAQRMLHALREPVLLAGQEVFVTASVGVAVYPRDGDCVADLVRNADVAMYAGKAQGRDATVLYTPMLAGRGREKLELESALHKAIERDELVLHYQPKVDVRSGSMVGAEALMRWRRAGVLVQPNEFIPLAEESGLIVPLSAWAVREAARQARLWQLGFGFDHTIAVNLPSRLFERSDLIDQVHEAVQAYGVAARSIQFEITETGLMKDLQSVMPSLHRLTEAGVQIAIDDFGTGYSSLAYLTTLPIAEVKIDRSFVRDLGITPQSSAIVTAIIALARALSLRVVAEGVESERQMSALHGLGCHLMQGFLFSRAIAGDEVGRWIEQSVLPRMAPWPIGTDPGAPPAVSTLRAVPRR